MTIGGCTFKFSPFWTVHPTWREAICFIMGYAGDGYNPKDCPTMPVIENVLADGFPMRSVRLKDLTAKAA